MSKILRMQKLASLNDFACVVITLLRKSLHMHAQIKIKKYEKSIKVQTKITIKQIHSNKEATVV